MPDQEWDDIVDDVLDKVGEGLDSLAAKFYEGAKKSVEREAVAWREAVEKLMVELRRSAEKKIGRALKKREESEIIEAALELADLHTDDEYYRFTEDLQVLIAKEMRKIAWPKESKSGYQTMEAAGGYDVMARVLLGTREAAGGTLQPVYDILRDYIDRALGQLKREGLTVGIEDSELDLVVYVHGVDADSPRQAGELVFNQLKRDGAMVVAEVQPQEA